LNIKLRSRVTEVRIRIKRKVSDHLHVLWYQFYLCFYNFAVRFWNCSDSVVLLFYFILWPHQDLVFSDFTVRLDMILRSTRQTRDVSRWRQQHLLRCGIVWLNLNYYHFPHVCIVSKLVFQMFQEIYCTHEI
jgi:hypothetical protein